MNSIVKKYISLITEQDINKFALKNGINLSKQELDILYDNVKNNFDSVIKDTETVFFKVKNKFSEENSIKIYNLLEYYKKRYKNYL